MTRGGDNTTCQLLLAFMLAAVVTEGICNIRKAREPHLHKNSAIPSSFYLPFRRPAISGSDNEMKMLTGMSREDRQILMENLPVSHHQEFSLKATQNSEPEVQNIVENMVEVMEMEEEKAHTKDEILPFLKEMADSMNSTMKLQTRMSHQTSNESLSKFQDTVLNFLAISGIEALLPLDCGKNPISPEDPLPGDGVYPWVAALGSNEDGKFHYRCTGALITRHHILTDADCASSPNINVVMMNVSVAPGRGAVFNFVAGRRVHPTIKNDDDLLSGNNIGILELALPYDSSDYIQPVCLAGLFETPDPNERSEITIVGYEITDLPSGRIAGLYNWPRSRTLGAEFCFAAIRTLKNNNPEIKTTLEDILTKKHICVDRHFQEVGKSIILKVDEDTGRVKLIGVGGVANAAKTNPIAYTLVQPHRFWVELVLKKFKDNTV